MKDAALMTWEWDGEAMYPLPRFRRQCDELFVVHERYRMEVQEERSWISHKHQFAWLHEAWLSLPEHIAERFLNEDMLRKHALIKGGFCDSATVVCSSKAEAMRWATFLRSDDAYCIAIADGTTVTKFTARSQSVRAMGAKEFQRSKQSVLDFIASLLQVEPKALVDAA